MMLYYDIQKMETRLATNNAKRLYFKHGLKVFSVYFTIIYLSTREPG
jgi:hypothetical protein